MKCHNNEIPLKCVVEETVLVGTEESSEVVETVDH